MSNQYHLAQMSISKAKAPLDDPMMSEFVSQLPVINAIADKAQGFVWRLQTVEGNSTAVRAYEDPSILMNMSVWESVETLLNFVYRGPHAGPYKNARQWFDRIEGHSTVLWWIPAGELPTVRDGVERMQKINAEGPTADAFNFQQSFPPPINHDQFEVAQTNV